MSTAGYGTIEIHEIPWVLIALVGALYWFRNARECRRDLAAAVLLQVGNGRLLWAKFSVLLTTIMFSIESLFVVSGVASMIRPAPEQPYMWTRLVIVYSFIVSSTLFTFVAYRWKQTNDGIRGVLKKRDTALAAGLPDPAISYVRNTPEQAPPDDGASRS